MKSNTIAFAAVAAQLAAAQNFNFAAVYQAPSPSLTQAPLTVASPSATSVYTVATASVAASLLASVVTTAQTASITGSAASAASTLTAPTTIAINKRGLLQDLLNAWGITIKLPTPTTSSAKTTLVTSVKTTSSAVKTTSSSSSSSSSSVPPVTSSASTTSAPQTSTVTSSSTSACPTTPEAGTYCGFINPEDPCAPQPDGYGPQVQPDTVAAFLAYQPFQQMALSAPTPGNYSAVFKNLTAATSANSYLGLYTLQSYDTAGCAAHCDNTNLCTAFNIYIERDPSLNPTTNQTWTSYATNQTAVYNCPNPSSITNYKCTLWGSNIDNTTATNQGGWRGNGFQVVIAGSNGYDKTNVTVPATIPAWTPPSNCTGGAITSGGSYWIGSNFFPGPFNPALCGVYAQTQNAVNKQVAQAQGLSSYTPCNMFNAYTVHKNGIAQGTYCALYDAALSTSWASFSGAWNGADFFGIRNSWTYTQTTIDSGKC